jgi:hypothetical protein
MSKYEPELPSWLWLWLPPAIVPALFISKLAGEDVYERTMHHEFSVPELGTVVVTLIAVVAGAWTVLHRRRLPVKWLGAWLGLLTLGCLYFAGEEASWGQHYFGWGTPEALAAVNAQHETNIHNIAGVFDQLPRTLLTIGVIVGGILAPILLRLRTGSWRPIEGVWGWVLPTAVCLPTAVLATVIGLPRRLAESSGGELPRLLDYAGGEFKEYFFGLFLMLYLLSIASRMRPLPETA